MLLVKKPKFDNKTVSGWLSLLYYLKGVCEIYVPHLLLNLRNFSLSVSSHVKHSWAIHLFCSNRVDINHTFTRNTNPHIAFDSKIISAFKEKESSVSFSIPEGLLHWPGCGLFWSTYTYCSQLSGSLFYSLENIAIHRNHPMRTG